MALAYLITDGIQGGGTTPLMEYVSGTWFANQNLSLYAPSGKKAVGLCIYMANSKFVVADGKGYAWIPNQSTQYPISLNGNKIEVLSGYGSLDFNYVGFVMYED